MTTTFAGVDVLGHGLRAPVGKSIASPNGHMAAGTYTYKMTFSTQYGETHASYASTPIEVVNNSIKLTLPLANEAAICARTIYRSLCNANNGPWYLLITLRDNVTREFVDCQPDSAIQNNLCPPRDNLASSVSIFRGWVGQTHPNLRSVRWGIASLGTDNHTGFQLYDEENFFTRVDIGTGANLPPLAPNLIGMHVEVRNNGQNPLRVYAYDDSCSQIDGLPPSHGTIVLPNMTLEVIASLYNQAGPIKYKWSTTRNSE